MAKIRKKHTGFFPWNDPNDQTKGFKLNFSEVSYVEIGRTIEGYKHCQFVELRQPQLALEFDYPAEFYLSAEGWILIKTQQGKYANIAKTDQS